jgi:hypothetical protein
MKLVTSREYFLQIPKDWFLFVIVLVVVAVEFLVFLVGTAIPSSRLRAARVADEQHPTSIVSCAEN